MSDGITDAGRGYNYFMFKTTKTTKCTSEPVRSDNICIACKEYLYDCRCPIVEHDELTDAAIDLIMEHPKVLKRVAALRDNCAKECDHAAKVVASTSLADCFRIVAAAIRKVSL